VIKTTHAVLAVLGAQASEGKTRNCISCGECRVVCPVGLDPEALFKRIIRIQNGEKTGEPYASANYHDSYGYHDSHGCHGCGCCELVCPSRLPLSQTIANAESVGQRRAGHGEDSHAG
jgi:electron transport complex protein RnfC